MNSYTAYIKNRRPLFKRWEVFSQSDVQGLLLCWYFIMSSPELQLIGKLKLKITTKAQLYSSAQTKADSEQNDENLFVCPHSSKPNVVGIPFGLVCQNECICQMILSVSNGYWVTVNLKWYFFLISSISFFKMSGCFQYFSLNFSLMSLIILTASNPAMGWVVFLSLFIARKV